MVTDAQQKVYVLDSHAAYGKDAAEEEDGVHDSFQPLGRGAGQLESFHKNT
jgi:hypothetical protein